MATLTLTTVPSKTGPVEVRIYRVSSTGTLTGTNGTSEFVPGAMVQVTLLGTSP